jgi:hypothetical protein
MAEPDIAESVVNVGGSRMTMKVGGKRLLTFGPATVITLVAAVVVGGNALKMEMQARGRRSAPIVERLTGEGPQYRLGPTPGLRFLLDRRGALHLSPEQASGISRMQAEWNARYAPAVREAEGAAAGLGSYLSRSQGQRTPAQQIESQARPLTSLSRNISTARAAYWSRAMRLLTPRQRRLVDEERESAYSKQREALARAVRQQADER